MLTKKVFTKISKYTKENFHKNEKWLKGLILFLDTQKF